MKAREPNTRLWPCEVTYDPRWLGWDRSEKQLWAEAQSFGLVYRGDSRHPDEKLREYFGDLARDTEAALERILVATFIRLGRPAEGIIEDEHLAQELGMSIYLFLADRVADLVEVLKQRTTEQRTTEQKVFCSVRSLCFALGAHVKDHGRAIEVGAWKAYALEEGNTYWQWGSAEIFEALRQQYAPSAVAVLT